MATPGTTAVPAKITNTAGIMGMPSRKMVNNALAAMQANNRTAPLPFVVLAMSVLYAAWPMG